MDKWVLFNTGGTGEWDKESSEGNRVGCMVNEEFGMEAMDKVCKAAADEGACERLKNTK